MVELVRDAFMDGMTTAFRLDTALALAAAAVTVLFVGGRVHLRGRPAKTTAA